MSDSWFEFHVAPDGDIEDGVNPESAQALKKLLRKQISPQEAAVAITKSIEESSFPNHDLPKLWSFLVDALMELPSENIRLLLALLKAIENLPEPDFFFSEEETKPPAHGSLWRGLGDFGNEYFDTHGSDSWESTTKDGNIDELRAYQIRRANIEAGLVVEGIGGIPFGEGYKRVAQALERVIHDHAVLDIRVSAAAEWLTIAGERFRIGAMKEEESWGLRNRSPGEDLWNEGEAMTWQRLSFWEERLKAMKSVKISNAPERALKACRAIRELQ